MDNNYIMYQFQLSNYTYTYAINFIANFKHNTALASTNLEVDIGTYTKLTRELAIMMVTTFTNDGNCCMHSSKLIFPLVNLRYLIKPFNLISFSALLIFIAFHM